MFLPLNDGAVPLVRAYPDLTGTNDRGGRSEAPALGARAGAGGQSNGQTMDTSREALTTMAATASTGVPSMMNVSRSRVASRTIFKMP